MARKIEGSTFVVFQKITVPDIGEVFAPVMKGFPGTAQAVTWIKNQANGGSIASGQYLVCQATKLVVPKVVVEIHEGPAGPSIGCTDMNLDSDSTEDESDTEEVVEQRVEEAVKIDTAVIEQVGGNW